MEEINKETPSSSGHDFISAFGYLEGVQKSTTSSVREKRTAWRQQSLLIQSLEGTLADDFMERHWTRHRPPSIKDYEETHKNIDALLGKDDYHRDVEFPDIDHFDIPAEPNLDQDMFDKPYFKNKHQQCEEVNTSHAATNSKNCGLSSKDHEMFDKPYFKKKYQQCEEVNTSHAATNSKNVDLSSKDHEMFDKPYFKNKYQQCEEVNTSHAATNSKNWGLSSKDQEMIDKPYFKNKYQQFEEVNTSHAATNIKNGDLSSKTRNTMDNFLKGRLPTANQQPTFSSARQLLAAEMLKKNVQNDGPAYRQENFSNNLQRTDVGFNFSATKKSLGGIGRVLNSTRKNFISPVRRKSASVTDTDLKSDENSNTDMSNPALKNVDPRMVELINNEIIYKFKPVDWNEVAGLDYAKSIIKEAVVYPLLRPDIFTGLRRPPKGILLFGPPGTGKTLIGKCIASQSSSTFFSISSASLTSKWMGEGEKMVRALFAVAVARQPSVIFIDEIDSILSQRSENENEGTRRLKTEFLVRLDGAATSDDDRVLIVGATNRPQELDEAVRRRFVKRLYVALPEVDARAEILTNLLKTVENNLSLSQIQEISQLAEGYSGADMDSLCREASMEPLRSLPPDAIITFKKENLRQVDIADFYTALKKIRPSVSQSDLNQYVEWNKMYGSSF